MENDLIRRGDLLGIISPDTPENHRSYVLMSDARKILIEFARRPKAVDAVEVVRCHECQSHTEDPETGKHYCWKPLGCMGCIEVKPDDFCSRGERKEN